MNYKILDIETYYRKDAFLRFTEMSKASISITHKLDVTALQQHSKMTGTKFYINFLYCLARVINSRDDYKMAYFWQTKQTVVFDKMNIKHYVFFEDTETCTPIYTEFDDDYETFYKRCSDDIALAKQKHEGNKEPEAQNYFEASYISWISYESLHLELPDGFLFFQPIINWGRYSKENEKLIMPITIRMNHAVADGYLVAKAFLLLESEIKSLTSKK